MIVDTPYTNINIKPLLEVEDNASDKEFLLFKLYRRVLLQNAKNITKLAAKNSDPQIFTISQIVLLAIPAKNRLTGKAPRLPYRVLKIARGTHTLFS